jgi:hypothetical protein
MGHPRNYPETIAFLRSCFVLPTSLPTAICAEMEGSYQLTTPEKHRFRTLEALDGRTLAAKFARDLVRRLEADLGGDLTAAQAELVKRAAVLGAFIADCEARYLSGEQPDMATWLAATNNQRRILETLGTQRVAKEVSLTDYIARKHAHHGPRNEE